MIKVILLTVWFGFSLSLLGYHVVVNVFDIPYKLELKRLLRAERQRMKNEQKKMKKDMVKYVITATAWVENDDGSFTYDRTIVDDKFTAPREKASTKTDDRRNLSHAFFRIANIFCDDFRGAKESE